MRTALSLKPMPALEQAQPTAVARRKTKKPTATAASAPTVTPICAPALAALYREHGPAISSHCRRFLPSPAAARDAMHEAFTRVLAKGVVLPSQESQAVRYLYRVSINVCLNTIRRTEAQSRAARGFATLNDTQTSSTEGDVASRQLVRALLGSCRDGDAQVAIMHYLDGMTQVEIARVLGISRRSVFNRLRKLARMAAELIDLPQPPSQLA